MRSTIQLALTGASFFSAAFAAPAAVPSGAGYGSAHPSGSQSYAPSSTVVPFVNDGFPNFSPQQLQAVDIIAHGTDPNGPPPPSLSQQGGVNLQFIEFNENFEVAFFASLLHNITTGVSGFEITDSSQKQFIISAITAVLAQEELHATNARTALTHFGRTVVNPCPSYKFPTTTFEDAIVLAKTFTDVTLGTLQDVINIFAQNGDQGLPGSVGSVIGQEGEQNGFYRILQNQNLIPSALPFLTASTRDFAFSALQGFVNGYCPANDILIDDGLKIFGVLNLLTTNILPKDQNLQFSFDIASLKNSKNLDFSSLFSGSNCGSSCSTYQQSWSKGSSGNMGSFDWSSSNLYLQYINQQNLPVAEKLQNVKLSGTTVTFDAFFPFTENLLNSLTIAAVTVGTNFTNANDVAQHTLFAPALIEVN